MKKFVLLSYGFEQPTPEIMEAVNNWFESNGDKVVDGGNPFGSGREISKGGTKELPLDRDAITGYMIFNAEDMDEAEKVASTFPIITSVRVYEAMSM